MGEFVPVAPAHTIGEGEMEAYTVGSQRIAVARLDGVLYAFDDICTHAACSLSQGELEDGSVICPCHFGQYELASGAVLDGPPPAPINVYPAREVNGTVEIQP